MKRLKYPPLSQKLTMQPPTPARLNLKNNNSSASTECNLLLTNTLPQPRTTNSPLAHLNHNPSSLHHHASDTTLHLVNIDRERESCLLHPRVRKRKSRAATFSVSVREPEGRKGEAVHKFLLHHHHHQLQPFHQFQPQHHNCHPRPKSDQHLQSLREPRGKFDSFCAA